MIKAPSLGVSGIAHGFFTRQGGVSEGIYASLNCGPGSGDAPEAVAENRRRARDMLAGSAAARLVTLYQIHSPEAVTVEDAWAEGAGPKADAMATARPGVMLGILTADCAPVLLADPDARVVGAAHAGWGGAFLGVIESVVAAMERLGARRENIRAAIGPCISQSAYEVGPEFEQRFRAAAADNTRFFAPSSREGHWQFNLEAYVAQRLSAAGIGKVEPLSLCTYAREAEFFSYRRTTHRKEPDYGRHLSAIMLAPSL
jgi:YfiH family protein